MKRVERCNGRKAVGPHQLDPLAVELTPWGVFPARSLRQPVECLSVKSEKGQA